jgi:glycosidase
MRFVVSFILFVFPLHFTFSQVSTIPSFPKADEPVTIIYDATQGASGLTGASRVFMHAGVILSSPEGTNWQHVVGAWGDPNSPGEMSPVPGEPNKWQITITPRSYFAQAGLSPTVTVYRIGMVFRSAGPCGGFQGNSSPCAEGKAIGGGDIYVNLFQENNPLALKILTPLNSGFFVGPGQEVEVSAESISPAKLSFFVNGNEVFSQENTTTASIHVQVESGKYEVEVKAEAGSESVAESTYFLTLIPNTIEPVPNGVQDGINYISDNTITLSLFAPHKNFVYLIGDFNNWELDPAYLMKKSPDGDRYWLTIDVAQGVEYGFQYAVYENQSKFVRVGDPYSEKILDSFNDSFIPGSIYPDIKPYPVGKTTGTVSVLQPTYLDYEWQTSDYVRPDKEKLVTYELLVRDFENPGTFQSVIDKLPYLKELGINSIELMPIMEFSGNDSWGYNPIYFFAVDKAYGPANKLKELIDKAHGHGMSVILDMVLNHADFECPLVKMYFENGQPATNSPYFNQQATHPFSVFYDFNHETTPTQQFADRVNRFWLEEYRFDGYRFDLSKGFTQRQTTDVGVWSQRDQSRIDLLKRMADQIWAFDPEAYVILEHFADNSEEIELANYGMMLWGNMHGAYKEASLGFTSGFQGVYHKNRGWNQAHLVSYMESHDEERLMYDAVNFGNSLGPYNIRNKDTALERMKMSAAFLFTVPGPKLFWQFGEYGYDISINQNGRTGRKPILWNYLEDPMRERLFKVYKEIIGLRNSYPVFHSDDFSMSGGSSTLKWITLTSQPYTTTPSGPEHMNVHIVGNFGVVAANITASFQHTGTWYSYFDEGRELSVSNTNMQILLQPGEFRIYTNYRLPNTERELVDYVLPNAPQLLSLTETTSGVQITWSDNSLVETNYRVFRSVDGLNFTQIRNQPRNSTSYLDNQVAPGTTYFYRVDAINSVGSVASNVLEITTDAPPITGILVDNFNKHFRLYPNPVEGDLNVLANDIVMENVKVEIHDMLGKKVNVDWELQEGQLIEINTQNLSKGLYLLTIQAQSQKFISRFVKR